MIVGVAVLAYSKYLLFIDIHKFSVCGKWGGDEIFWGWVSLRHNMLAIVDSGKVGVGMMALGEL